MGLIAFDFSFREDVTWVLYRSVKFLSLAEIVGVRMISLKLFIWFAAQAAAL
jgi:hypothetical protein